MNGALLRLESSFFKSDIFFLLIITFFLNLQVLKKPKKVTFHRTTVKKMLRQDR